MLTLEACKALKELGYPQGEPGVVYRVADGHVFWSYGGTWSGLVACPDSVDALDWLAAKYGTGYPWTREDDGDALVYGLIVTGVELVGLTPSDLILEVAKCVSTSPAP